MNFSFRILAVLVALMPLNSMAGYGDPWYLVYHVSGGTINQTLGPFGTQFECTGARLSLPLGAVFVGCFQ